MVLLHIKSVLVMVLLNIKERSRNGATPYKKNVLVMVLLHIKERSCNGATRSECVLVMAVL